MLGIPRSTAQQRYQVPRPLSIEWPQHPDIPLLDLSFVAAGRIPAVDAASVVRTGEAVLLALDAATENGIPDPDLAERAGHFSASQAASVESTVVSIAKTPVSPSQSEHMRTEPAQRAGHKRKRCEIEDEEDEEPEEQEGDAEPLSENA